MNNHEMRQQAGVVRNAPITNPASSIKVYAELIKRADIKSHSFTCSIDELAESLDYFRDYLDAILIDFLTSGIIDIRIGYKDSAKRKITLRVY